MKVISKGIPNLIIALGNEQENYIKKIFNKKIHTILLPCGILKNDNETISFKKDNNEKISFCYAGNIGEAHDENFLKKFIDNLDPNKHILTLSLYGSKSKSIIKYCRGKIGINIKEFIEKEDLNSIDIHIVSLKKEWDHICVPSKAVSAVCGGSAILFNCSDKNDNWKLLKDAGWRIRPDNHISLQIQKFMKNLSIEDINFKKKNALQISKKLNSIKTESFSKIYNYLIQKKYLIGEK